MHSFYKRDETRSYRVPKHVFYGRPAAAGLEEVLASLTGAACRRGPSQSQPDDPPPQCWEASSPSRDYERTHAASHGDILAFLKCRSINNVAHPSCLKRKDTSLCPSVREHHIHIVWQIMCTLWSSFLSIPYSLRLLVRGSRPCVVLECLRHCANVEPYELSLNLSLWHDLCSNIEMPLRLHAYLSRDVNGEFLLRLGSYPSFP